MDSTQVVVTTFTSRVLGGLSPLDFLVFLFFACMGLFLSLLVEVFRVRKKIALSGGFQMGYWWSRNWLRLIISFFVIICGLLLSQTFLGVALLTMGQVSNGIVFTFGFSTDKVLEIFIKKQKTTTP